MWWLSFYHGAAVIIEAMSLLRRMLAAVQAIGSATGALTRAGQQQSIIFVGMVISAAGCTTSPSTTSMITAQEPMNALARQQQIDAVMAVFEPLVACVKRRAAALAPEPEPADTIARAALSGCSQLHSRWAHAVMQANLFDYDHAISEIQQSDTKLRDMAIAIVIDLRFRPRQPPRPALPSAVSRTI